jgi:hypothetical protein
MISTLSSISQFPKFLAVPLSVFGSHATKLLSIVMADLRVLQYPCHKKEDNFRQQNHRYTAQLGFKTKNPFGKEALDNSQLVDENKYLRKTPVTLSAPEKSTTVSLVKPWKCTQERLRSHRIFQSQES